MGHLRLSLTLRKSDVVTLKGQVDLSRMVSPVIGKTSDVDAEFPKQLLEVARSSPCACACLPMFRWRP